MTTNDDFKRALNLNPEHTDTLLIYADWLQERDDPLADGFRELGMRRLWPWWFKGGHCWGWLERGMWELPQFLSHALPSDWFAKVPTCRHVTLGGGFDDVKHTPSAKRELWDTPKEKQWGAFVLFKAAARGWVGMSGAQRNRSAATEGVK